MAILMFGDPRFRNGSYGTYNYSAQVVTTSQAADFAKQFGRGYWVCVGDETASKLTIVIGTNNFGGETTYGHGQAWAQMVNSVQQWYENNGYSTQVTAQGGNDMELNWNTPSVTRNWVNAYDSVNTQRLYNFGDAAGCPQSGNGATNGNCNAGWTQDDIWYISWGASPAFPLPQQYNTVGAQAQQWKQLSLYAAVSKGARMDIAGALTQQGACQQQPPCNGINNSPTTGWSQLWDALNSNSRTAQNLLWITDIRYQ